MKLQNLLLFIFLASFVSCGKEASIRSNCLPLNLQNGLIAFYPFSNGSLEDKSAYSNHLNNPTSALPTNDRSGNMNCAFRFENSLRFRTEFLTTSNSSFLNNLDKFSISIWYQPLERVIFEKNIEVLLGRGNDEKRCPDRMGEWSVGLYDCRHAVFGHNSSVWAKPITSSNDCAEEYVALTNKWHHVVATKSDTLFKIYFNGILNGTKSGNGACSNLHLAQDIGDMFIGTAYTGRIDDILIYNRELSALEVTELFNLEPCCQ